MYPVTGSTLTPELLGVVKLLGIGSYTRRVDLELSWTLQLFELGTIVLRLSHIDKPRVPQSFTWEDSFILIRAGRFERKS